MHQRAYLQSDISQREAMERELGQGGKCSRGTSTLSDASSEMCLEPGLEAGK